jgi:cytoskeletal protein CcmA (bactofilin family)
MWKPNTPSNFPAADSASPALELIPCAVASACHQSILGKGLIFTGEITSSESFESLFIEGSVQGSINLPDSRVTVGQDGRVTAGIVAANIVVMGQVNGNLTAMDRVEIRAQASVTGDATAPRISVEDGAFLNGRLDVRNTASEPIDAVDFASHLPEPRKIVLVRSRAASSRIHASLQSA